VRCQPHFNRAVALEELDCAEDALNGYRKCLAIEPDYADAQYNLARLLRNFEGTSKARSGTTTGTAVSRAVDRRGLGSVVGTNGGRLNALKKGL
jgi:tetratricopeptide (TPR) repeat protein